MHPPYWEPFGPIMPMVNLPTPDMVQQAFPEGVLRLGGTVRGFLYLDGHWPDVNWAQLRATYENARSGDFITRLTIPFAVG